MQALRGVVECVLTGADFYKYILIYLYGERYTLAYQKHEVSHWGETAKFPNSFFLDRAFVHTKILGVIWVLYAPITPKNRLNVIKRKTSQTIDF